MKDKLAIQIFLICLLLFSVKAFAQSNNNAIVCEDLGPVIRCYEGTRPIYQGPNPNSPIIPGPGAPGTPPAPPPAPPSPGGGIFNGMVPNPFVFCSAPRPKFEPFKSIWNAICPK